MLRRLSSLLQRKTSCKSEEDVSSWEVPHIQTRAFRNITLPVLQLSESVSKEDAVGLLELVNKYRDCFAQNVFEIGKAAAAKLKIKMAQDTTTPISPRGCLTINKSM